MRDVDSGCLAHCTQVVTWQNRSHAWGLDIQLIVTATYLLWATAIYSSHIRSIDCVAGLCFGNPDMTRCV